MSKTEFEKLIMDIKGFSVAEKNLLISSYEIGFVAGSRAAQEIFWAEELKAYNAKAGLKFDA